MNVYIYKADILCEQCGEAIREELLASGEAPDDPDDEWSYDSGDFPAGPYANGGGESDVPEHCGECGVFLENPLTAYGREHVRDALDETPPTQIAIEWGAFYKLCARPRGL